MHDLVGPSKTDVLSTVTAIYDVGCFLGALVAFAIGDRLGRKKSILLGTTIMTIGTLLLATSFSLPQMFVGRVILGYGSGCCPLLDLGLRLTGREPQHRKWDQYSFCPYLAD